MANRTFQNFGHFYAPHNFPVLLDCNFIVDVANVNGLGLSSLKGPGIAKVYGHSTAAFTGTSHTSTLIDSISSTANLVVGMPVQGSGIAAGTTIATIIDGVSITLSAATSTSTTGSITYQAVGSPNPPAGYWIVQFQDSYYRRYATLGAFKAQLDASSQTSTAANTVEVITALGTATLAQWQAVGLPQGVTPAVGVAFVATATAAIGGSAAVQHANANGAGIVCIEDVGDARLTLGVPAGLVGQSLPYMILRTMGATSASVTTLVATAPVDLSTLYLEFYLSNSSVTVQGE